MFCCCLHDISFVCALHIVSDLAVRIKKTKLLRIFFLYLSSWCHHSHGWTSICAPNKLYTNGNSDKWICMLIYIKFTKYWANVTLITATYPIYTCISHSKLCILFALANAKTHYYHYYEWQTEKFTYSSRMQTELQHFLMFCHQPNRFRVKDEHSQNSIPLFRYEI